jgi:hypothetical protein
MPKCDSGKLKKQTDKSKKPALVADVTVVRVAVRHKGSAQLVF